MICVRKMDSDLHFGVEQKVLFGIMYQGMTDACFYEIGLAGANSK